MAESRRLTLVTDEPSAQQPWSRLVWTGDLDATSAPPLAADLRRAWELDPLVLEVDLAGVTSMDTAGLRPLVEAHARLLDRLRLFDPPQAVTRVLALHGLEDMFLVVGPLPAVPATEPLPLSDAGRVRIEQAKGLLMAVHGCDAPSAWTILRSHARAHAVRVDVMAGLLVDHAPGAMPPSSETVLDDVLAERARAGSPAE